MSTLVERRDREPNRLLAPLEPLAVEHRVLRPSIPGTNGPGPAGSRRDPPLELASVPLDELPPRTREGMVALARSACPGIDVASYLEARFARYSRALTMTSPIGLLAFEFIEEFEQDGEKFVYLGPVFSRGGACLAMLHSYVRQLIETAPGAFHLLAEVQNPEALLRFKTLFLRTSWPGFSSIRPPRRVRRAAATFARRLDHIHGLDPDNLVTRGLASGDTLFAGAPRAASARAVTRWLDARGVRLERGDSLVVAVSCRGTFPDRLRLSEDLRRGMERFGDRHGWRRPMLAKFERAVGHEA